MKLKLPTILRLITLLSLTVLIGAKQNANTAVKQKIYFERYYINYAWGLSYTHYIIDDEGNLRMNRKKNFVVWIDPNQLNDYVSEFDSVVLKIDPTEVKRYVAMIKAASKGEIHTGGSKSFDAGTTGYNCFWYDNTSNRFETILLSKDGDEGDKTNIDSSAKKIVAWMISLDKKVFWAKR